jgi:GTP-binding protein EngB required for normal cell division
MSEDDDQLIEISETFRLLDAYVPPHSDQLNNVVLFVGLSGCGKSTLLQYITNNPNLVSQSRGSSQDFYIGDGNDKISDSTTKSKTKFPDLITDSVSKSTFADCPGFSDTRSCKHEITAAICTRTLLDKVKTLKIVILTGHHSVRKNFDKILK